MKHTVKSVWTHSRAHRLAFDTVFGDLIRLIQAQPEYVYLTDQMSRKVLAKEYTKVRAQAFLTALRMHRGLLTYLEREGHVRNQLAANMFQCAPMGASLEPHWPRKKYTCKKILCPWCRYRQIHELAADPWVHLQKKVHVYRLSFDAQDLKGVLDMREESERMRHNLLRNLDVPYIRFQRLGLEHFKSTGTVYRMVQLLVTQSLRDVTEGWEHLTLDYGKLLEAAFRYPAANIAFPDNWEMAADLLRIHRFRVYDLSRRDRSGI